MWNLGSKKAWVSRSHPRMHLSWAFSPIISGGTAVPTGCPKEKPPVGGIEGKQDARCARHEDSLRGRRIIKVEWAGLAQPLRDYRGGQGLWPICHHLLELPPRFAFIITGHPAVLQVSLGLLSVCPTEELLVCHQTEFTVSIIGLACWL